MATQKELFERIIDTMADDEEVVAMAQKYVDRLSKPRKPKVNKEAEKTAEIVRDFLDANPYSTLTEIADGLGCSWQKASAAIKRLGDEVGKQEPDTKNGKPAFYLQ